MNREVEAFGALATPRKLDDDAIEARTTELLASMSQDERTQLLSGDTPFWSGLADMVNGAYGDHAWVAGSVRRLGIPGIRFVDGPRGVVLAGATTFPVPMARGATFDPSLEERVGEVMGRETRALGANFFGGVCVNLLRHPAWGRAQETFGEDPLHVGHMGLASVLGVQRHVMACVKHFALNSMENARFKVDVEVDERALHEVYLPHFERIVRGGVASVMSAYNRVNGAWAGESAPLLRDVLVTRWGFGGFVITDFIFGMRSAKRAIDGGQHLEMPFRMHFANGLPRLREQGLLDETRVDDAARRILRQTVRFGQGRDASDYAPSAVGAASSLALSREVAARSFVLLKNEGVLPLSPGQRVAVIGRLAAMANTGDRGSSNTRPAHVVTPLEGLQAALGPSVTVEHDDGRDPERAAALAARSDAVIVVVGYTYEDEGEFVVPEGRASFARLFPRPRLSELGHVARLLRGLAKPGDSISSFAPGGDRARLTLRPEDEALVRRVASVQPNHVVVLMAGSALVTEAFRREARAILMAWYPGQEGGHALADVLLGRANPAGRLPCTFPVRADDLPHFDRDATRAQYGLLHGYRLLATRRVRAAFPFGWGLSYTRFTLTEPRLEGRDESGAVRASVLVSNVGERAGRTLVQVYLNAEPSRVERPATWLGAFESVALDAGERARVTLRVPLRQFAHFERGRFVVEATTYGLRFADHAEDETMPKLAVALPACDYVAER